MVVSEASVIVTSVVLPAAPVPTTPGNGWMRRECEISQVYGITLRHSGNSPREIVCLVQKKRAALAFKRRCLRSGTAKFESSFVINMKLSVPSYCTLKVQFPVAGIDCSQVYYWVC